MHATQIAKSKRRKPHQPLVVVGKLRHPDTIPSWELELVEPALVQLAHGAAIEPPTLFQDDGHENP